jgi:transposase
VSRVCKSYDSHLKAKVAIAALKGESSILEICKEHNIPKTNVLDWKNKLVEEAASLYIPTNERAKAERILKQEIEGLQKIIGEITVENCFLKKKLQK